MSDESKKLQVEIEINKTGQGGADAAKDLSKVNDELNNLSPATKKYIDSLKEQKQEEQKGGESKGELRRGIRELGAEFPILGDLGRLAMDPLIGAFVLLTAVVKATWEGIQELGNRSTPEFEGLTKAVEDQKEAMEAVDLAANAYERSLARLAETSRTVQQESASHWSKIKQGADNSMGIDDKVHELQEAKIDSAEKMGVISHAQAIAAKLALDEQYFAKRVKMQNDLDALEVANKYREKMGAEIEATALEKKLTVQKGAAKTAAGKEKFVTDEKATDEENLKKTQDKLAELQKEEAELHEKTTGLGRFTTITPQIVLEAQKTQNQLEQKAQVEIAEKLRAKIKQDSEAEFKAKDASASANEDKAATEARIRQDRERAHELEQELPDDTRAMQERVKQRNTIGGLDEQIREFKAAPELSAAGASLGHATESLSTALSTINSNVRQLIQTGHTQNQTAASHDAAIKELQREAEQLRDKMKYSRQTFGVIG